MSDERRPPRSQARRTVDGVVWGLLIGGAAGAVIGDGIGWLGAAAGALIGATLYTPAEVLTTRLRGAGETKPLWHRILSAALLMALVGWLLGVILGDDRTLAIALICGGALGLAGLRAAKLGIGLAVGAAVGVLFGLPDGGVAPAIVAAVVTVVYRLVSAVVYRGRPLVRIMAEGVPASTLRYVVPFEARSRQVGADYVAQLAQVRGGTFRRNATGVGILESLDSLAGPTFDPALVHPLVREFYEHTSRFRLSIVPEWRPWMRPVYAIFKRVVAEPLGQAAIPSNIEEAQRGMVSTIDTLTLAGEDEIAIRGWIRTYADSGRPIYVGIYTTFRHEGRGYVSVGFPLPSANFTATLLPRNAGDHDLELTSRSPLPFPGHYLSSVDSKRDALTVLKLLSFHERIVVFVDGGELRAAHSFSLAGARFLTLRYEMERAPEPQP